jgi:hypothetical protein
MHNFLSARSKKNASSGSHRPAVPKAQTQRLLHYSSRFNAEYAVANRTWTAGAPVEDRAIERLLFQAEYADFSFFSG